MIFRAEKDAPAKVSVDGTDVSDACFFADDIAGAAYCYVFEPAPGGGRQVKLDETGTHIVDRKIGKVVIEPVKTYKHPFAG